MKGGFHGTIIVQTEERDGLLAKTLGVVRSKLRSSRHHAEIIREGSRLSRSEQVVDHNATLYTGKIPISPPEIQGREPIVGFVFNDGSRCAFTVT
jgi:hypothetical protein